MARKVAAVIGENSLSIDWDPDIEGSTKCCLFEEVAVQNSLREKGIETIKESVSCKLQDVPVACELGTKEEITNG